jgi:uncharacterized protein YndB with AHSA1/START domain
VPSFHDQANTAAAPEEVWKLLYDPSRFPEWWAGIGSVEFAGAGAGAGSGQYTMYPDGYPDFPMAQLLDSRREEQRVTVSCLVSDLKFEWRLEPAGGGTSIAVDVVIPEAEANRLEAQRGLISQSLQRLAELAAESTR